MARSMKVKVKVAELLKAVESKKVEADAELASAEVEAVEEGAEYDKAAVEYAEAVSEWKELAKSGLVEAISELDLDDIQVYEYGDRAEVSVCRVKVPAKPPMPKPLRRSRAVRTDADGNEQFVTHRLAIALMKVERMQRTINTLKIAADDAILVSADDYAEYLG